MIAPRIRVLTTLLSLLLLLPLVAHAQSTEIGFLGGLNISDLAGDEVEGTDTRNGYHVGVFLNLEVTEAFSIQPELLLTRKGADIFDGGDLANLGVELDYIEIPILGQLRFPTEGKARAHLLFGPAIAFEIGCRGTVEVLTVEADQDCDIVDVGDGNLLTNSVDFGVIFGAGFEFDLGENRGFIDARFDAGLADISDIPGTGTVNNRAFMITAGFGFPIG